MTTKGRVFCGVLTFAALLSACSPSSTPTASTLPTAPTPPTAPPSASNGNGQAPREPFAGFKGTYTESDGVVTLRWNDNQNVNAPWRPATATLRGNVLSVRYDIIMQMDDFENADYILSPESSNASRVYVFLDAPYPPRDYTKASRYVLLDDGAFTLGF